LDTALARRALKNKQLRRRIQMQDNKIALFQGKQIRKVFHETNGGFPLLMLSRPWLVAEGRANIGATLKRSLFPKAILKCPKKSDS
jgi:hypothetical protein